MSKFITCVQTGASTSRTQDDQDESPMKAWRCDLTALSQSHNLYFVACCDTILVYQPEFPDQRLSEPKLVLQPPVSAPDLEPYIDPEDPHSITRLLVDYLGNDEILLATCDDGDVIGYRVGEIQRVLDLAQQTSDEGEEPDFAAHVRVFLHRNVGLSAWGLAIHREARIIAISANTHEITVLAFALAAGGDVPPEGSFLDTIMGSDFPSPRRRNHIFTLKAGQNIPSVSFNNSEEDSGGRWLFATCITGETTLWDLHNPGVPARVIRMGWCRSTSSPLVAPPPTSGGCQCVGATGYPHATWNATFLDPRSAHEVSPSDCEWTTGNDAPFFDDAEAQKERFRSEQSGLGHSTEHVATDEGALYHASDLTTSGHVSTNEEAMNLLEGASESSQSGNDYSSDSMWIDEGVDTGTSYPDHANPPDRHSDEDDDMEHEQEPQVSTAPTLPSIQDHLTDYADSVMGPPQPMQPAYMPYAVTGFPQFPISLDEIADLISGSMEYDSEVEDDGEFAYMPPQFHAHPHYENLAGLHVQPPAYREFKDDPSFTGFNNHQPCLIVSKDDIFLLKSPFNKIDDQPEYMLAKRRAAGDEPDHTLVMRRPLYTHPWRPNPVSADRLCFCTQIPEMGIFIVASPTGRAAIFALTRSHSADKGYHYGFHLEYILPLNKNEPMILNQHHPPKRLVGVAVGPVQGMLGRDGRGDRTWRLMMYFTDHSAMSFELKRKRVKGTPSLGDLVV